MEGGISQIIRTHPGHFARGVAGHAQREEWSNLSFIPFGFGDIDKKSRPNDL